jgi:exodeoxyribonuclease VII large subunit
VGHELDVSLCDLVADARAATPSQAAELVVPDAATRRAALRRSFAAVERAMLAHVYGLRAQVDRRRARLGDPRLVVAERQRELDELLARLFRRTERGLKRRGQTTAGLLSRLFAHHPRVVISAQRSLVSPLAARLMGAFRLGLGKQRERLSAQAARLDALSPLGVLGRGYAIAWSRDGRALRRSAEAKPGQALLLRLGEGALDVEVLRIVKGDEEKPS